MGLAVITVAGGGMAVVESTNGRGLPVTEAANGRGIKVTKQVGALKYGVPVIFVTPPLLREGAARDNAKAGRGRAGPV